MKNKEVSIALGSGGAKGISHIGVLEILERNGIRISEISGCSIGAIVGAIYAAGVSIEKMKEIAFSIDLKKLLNLFDFTKPTTGGIIKGNIVEDFLEEILPVKKFEDLRMPFKCVATDIKSGKGIAFEKGNLIPAIRASISIPGLFVPYNYQGKLFVDGGVVNPIPVNLLSNSDCYKIAVVVKEYKAIKKLIKQRATIENKIKQFINEKFSVTIKKIANNKRNKKGIGIIKLLSSTIDTITTELLEFDLDNYNVDIIIKPEVEDIAILGFYNAYKSYCKGIKAAEAIINQINELK